MSATELTYNSDRLFNATILLSCPYAMDGMGETDIHFSKFHASTLVESVEGEEPGQEQEVEDVCGVCSVPLIVTNAICCGKYCIVERTLCMR